MNKQAWSRRVIMRYALLQLPGVALLLLTLILIQRWIDLPGWIIWGFLALWVAKDVILFPFVWRAYGGDRPEDANPMLGVRGTAKDRLDPSGYVHVRGELWQAEVTGDAPPIEKGEGVRVEGIRGLTLLVQQENSEVVNRAKEKTPKFPH